MTNPTADIEIPKIVDLLTKATPGEWECLGEQGTALWAAERMLMQASAPRAHAGNSHINTALIAAAHNALPELLRLARIGARALRAQKYELFVYRDYSDMEERDDGDWLRASDVLGEGE